MPEKSTRTYLGTHFTLKHRAIAAVSRLVDNLAYTARRGLVKGLRRRGGLGFVPEWIIPFNKETAEVRFFRDLDLANKVVYDVGGFQGLLTIFFASRARSVVVYEPTSRNRSKLEENIRLNGFRNVIVRPVGAGATASTLELSFDPHMMGGASGDASIARQIRETSPGAIVEQIAIVPIDEDVERLGLPLPDFVKLDIEGMELPAIRGMQTLLTRRHPELYIVNNGATREEKIQRAGDLLSELAALGYRNIRHIESGLTVDVTNAAAAAEGHLYC